MSFCRVCSERCRSRSVSLNIFRKLFHFPMPSACFNSYDRDGILSEEKWLRRPCLPRFGVPRRRPARKKKRGERSLKFAFGVHSFAQAGAWASHLTRIDLVTAGGKVSTGHSGLEVDRVARAFRAWLMPSHETAVPTPMHPSG